MVVNGATVVWTKRSQKQMKCSLDYIYYDSAQNAAKVVEEIVATVNKAVYNPEMYSQDKYKVNNDGTYRAFEKHRYRM